MSDSISRQAAIDFIDAGRLGNPNEPRWSDNEIVNFLKSRPSAQSEIIRCKDCKLNPKYEWFGCPMSHLSEKQRPETAWCWKAERRTDGSD